MVTEVWQLKDNSLDWNEIKIKAYFVHTSNIVRV